MEPCARKLLDVLHQKATVDWFRPELDNFVGFLSSLKKKHCRNSWSDEYMAPVCCRREIDFSTEIEYRQFCKVSLSLAESDLTSLLNSLANSTPPSEADTERLRNRLINYLFDLKPIVEHLERKKVPDYELFVGGKNYSVESFQLYSMSLHLANGSVDLSDHRTMQVAAIFLLRQSIETRLIRVIGVDLRDKYGQSPKLRHDFHFNYIESRAHFFQLKNGDLKVLKTVYDWCNDIVHSAFQPYAWQITFAHRVSACLFGHGPSKGGAGVSVYGAFQITDLAEMRQDFAMYFREKYDHGFWSVDFISPEAGVIRD